MLDAAEGPAQHERRDGGRRDRHADDAGHAGKAEGGGDPGELPAQRPEVGADQREQRKGGPADAEALPHQPDEPLAGDDAHARAELVEDDERAVEAVTTHRGHTRARPRRSSTS